VIMRAARLITGARGDAQASPAQAAGARPRYEPG
jgi:hypothetical protein